MSSHWVTVNYIVEEFGEQWLEFKGEKWVRVSDAARELKSEPKNLKRNKNFVPMCPHCNERLGVTWFSFCPACGGALQPERGRGNVHR